MRDSRDRVPASGRDPLSVAPLSLTVGCTFDLELPAETSAVLQVAPIGHNVQIRSERWDTTAIHHGYADSYGNRCERMLIPAGRSTIRYDAEVDLADPHDRRAPGTRETPIEELPDEQLIYVMPSRFCQPDELGHEAWQLFGQLQPGYERVQAIVDFVHNHLTWVAGTSNPWTTAIDAYRAEQGVCRDFAHLAITFCRALNIPARYVFGYIPEIDIPPPEEIMDFAAWFEVYLDGQWHTFDARNNRHRVGRVVVGRGRDAVDVALITTFGSMVLHQFEVRAA
ncbi:MAG: hypothetical protein QOF76_3853 [Solirubrobacteraceae bacterium]|nr:hypothetical protein [Solirubrobacteraceae bacterium]